MNITYIMSLFFFGDSQTLELNRHLMFQGLIKGTVTVVDIPVYLNGFNVLILYARRFRHIAEYTVFGWTQDTRFPKISLVKSWVQEPPKHGRTFYIRLDTRFLMTLWGIFFGNFRIQEPPPEYSRI